MVVIVGPDVEMVNAAGLTAKSDALLDRLKQAGPHKSVRLNQSLLRGQVDDRLAAADFIVNVPDGVEWRGPDGAVCPTAIHAAASLLVFDAADIAGTEVGMAFVIDVLATTHA